MYNLLFISIYHFSVGKRVNRLDFLKTVEKYFPVTKLRQQNIILLIWKKR